MDYTKEDIGKLPELDGAIRTIKFLAELQPVYDAVRHRKKTAFKRLGREGAAREAKEFEFHDWMIEYLWQENRHDLEWYLNHLSELYLTPNFNLKYQDEVRQEELKYIRSLMA